MGAGDGSGIPHLTPTLSVPKGGERDAGWRSAHPPKSLPGRAVAFAVVAALAGCSALAPYPTAPPALPPGQTAAVPRVAICYDGFADSRAAVRVRAQQECPARTVATYLATDLRLNHCPLLLPARATFTCILRK